jgi:S-adenosylmethionine hydrolase
MMGWNVSLMSASYRRLGSKPSGGTDPEPTYPGPMSTMPISLMTDFGLDDEFVGVLHGVLATIAPDSRVIDVSHAVARGNVRAGALTLLRAIQYLPQGVVVAVIDPGVGTERRAIAAETPWGYFVGPDNGLLSPAVALIGGATKVVAIESPDVVLPSQGATFDGRDRFAPAGGVLASGEANLEDLGPVLDPDSLMPLLLPLAEIEASSVTGQVWWVDHFGNAQTNVAPEDVAGLGLEPGSTVTVRVGATTHEVPWVRAYGEVAEGEPLIHVDSAGLLALAVRAGRAEEHLAIGEGVAVVLSAGKRASIPVVDVS